MLTIWRLTSWRADTVSSKGQTVRDKTLSQTGPDKNAVEHGISWTGSETNIY
jgi:hypothetical protein